VDSFSRRRFTQSPLNLRPGTTSKTTPLSRRRGGDPPFSHPGLFVGRRTRSARSTVERHAFEKDETRKLFGEIRQDFGEIRQGLPPMPQAQISPDQVSAQQLVPHQRARLSVGTEGLVVRWDESSTQAETEVWHAARRQTALAPVSETNSLYGL